MMFSQSGRIHINFRLTPHDVNMIRIRIAVQSEVSLLFLVAIAVPGNRGPVRSIYNELIVRTYNHVGRYLFGA